MKESGVPIDPTILEKIQAGTHLDLLIHRSSRMVQTVDFQRQRVEQVFTRNSYGIYLKSKLGKRIHLIFIRFGTSCLVCWRFALNDVASTKEHRMCKREAPSHKAPLRGAELYMCISAI